MSRTYWTTRRLQELDTKLSEHDRAVLGRVAELRFMRGDQLARLCFADVPIRTARQALLRLVRLEVLERLPRPVGGVRAGSGSFVYRLGPAGQRLIGQTWRPHVPGTLFVRHAFAVAELHSLLREADRAGRIELIELRAEPACWRPYPGGRLKPDSYLRLGAGEYEDSYFVEIDMGTEGSRALTTKLRQYAEYQRSGIEQSGHGVFPKVLWAALDERRAAVIQECVERLPEAPRRLFAVRPFAGALDFLTLDGSGQDAQRPAQ